MLASLARAGTPVGVLMRRWARYAHGLDLPHYTLSIVRGRGIDRVALRHLAAGTTRPTSRSSTAGPARARSPASSRPRSTAAERDDGLRFDPTLAVLADPGGCVPAVRHPRRLPHPVGLPQLDRVRPGVAHRAERRVHRAGRLPRREVLPRAQRVRCLDALHRRDHRALPGGGRPGRGRLAARWPPSDRSPDWRGWRTTDEVAARYGITDVNLVKPGVGETTRVLLRRVPWRVLVRPGRRRRASARAPARRAARRAGGGGARPAVLVRRPDPARLHDDDAPRPRRWRRNDSGSGGDRPRRHGAVLRSRDGLVAGPTRPADPDRRGRRPRLRLHDRHRDRRLDAGSPRDGVVLPATTRSVPQYTRLRLPGPAPKYAVVCNGARILVDGSSDPGWERRVRAALREAAPFAEVERQCAAWRSRARVRVAALGRGLFRLLHRHRA